MADVAGDQHLIRNLAWNVILAIRQMARLQRRINHDLVCFILQLQELSMREAKSPILAVIGCSIRNPVRVFRNGVQMLLQLRQSYRRPDRPAVIYDMMQEEENKYLLIPASFASSAS